MSQNNDATVPATEPSAKETPSSPFTILGSAPAPGLIGLNIAVDDAAVCGPDGCL